MLAIGLTFIVLAALWIGVAAPLLNWYHERAATLEYRRALSRRMADIAETLPDLQHRADAATVSGPPAKMLLEGSADPVAGAVLQEAVQQMAGAAGAVLTSAETLPAQDSGAYRRIGVRVSLRAPWPVLVRLLQSVEEATPKMLIDDLQLQASPLLLRTREASLDASFSIFAFRSANQGAAAAKPAGAGAGAGE